MCSLHTEYNSPQPPHPENFYFAGDKQEEDLSGCKKELVAVVVVIFLEYSFLMSINLTASINMTS